MSSKLKTRPAGQIEQRFVRAAELHSACRTRTVINQGKRQFVGYGARYDSLSLIMGKIREKIAPGAFDETLANGDDVRFLFNHDPSIILGRTTSRTLKLWSDRVGLAFEVDPPDTQAARDLEASIERGDISQCSFAFETLLDEWNEDKYGTIRTLRKVKLYDVSAVTYPAYPNTEVALRRLEAWARADYHRLQRLRLALLA